MALLSFTGASILSSTGFIYIGDEKVDVTTTPVDTALGTDTVTSPLIEIDLEGAVLRLPPTYVIETCNRGYVEVSSLTITDYVRVYVSTQAGTYDKVQSPSAIPAFTVTQRDSCYPIQALSTLSGAIFPPYASLEGLGYAIETDTSSIPVGSGPDGTNDPNSCYCLVPGSGVVDPNEIPVELTPDPPTIIIENVPPVVTIPPFTP